MCNVAGVCVVTFYVTRIESGDMLPLLTTLKGFRGFGLA